MLRRRIEPLIAILALAGFGAVLRGYADAVQWVRPGDAWRYLAVGASQGPPAGWHGPGFADEDWASGPGGVSVGFGTYQTGATALGPWVGAEPLRGLLLRREFVVDRPEDAAWIGLRIEYEDGLRVWLNGTEVVRSGYLAGPDVPWGASPAYHAVGNAEVFDLTAHAGALVAGTNLLAVQVVDASVGWPTVYAWAELRANFLRGPFLGPVSSNAVTVCWATATPAPGSVEILEEGREEARVVETGPASTQHELTITGLAPGTRYRWRAWTGVGAGGRGGWSEPSTVTTARASGDVTFLAIGDTGEGLLPQYQIADALRRERGDAVLHTGDIVYSTLIPGRLDLRCFSAYEELMRETPMYFTVGNHDAWGSLLAYATTFCQPTNSATGSELFYSFDHGDAHVTCLYAPWYGASGISDLRFSSRGPQYAWLTNDLARTSKPWKIVFFHQPPFTSGPHLIDDYDGTGRDDTEEAREGLLPILAEHGVQLVLNGHDHVWERFAPTNGVHFVVTGGGGAHLYPLVDRQPGSAQFFPVFHYTRVRIQGPEMTVEALDPQGRRVDGFVVRRRGTAETMVEAPFVSAPPPPSPVGPSDDGNERGETFPLVGPSLTPVPSGSANLGRFLAGYDADAVTFGFRDVMLWPGQTLALFVAGPRRGEPDGVRRLSGVGRERNHPFANWDLGFDGFEPSLVCLLGDELADGNAPDHRRPAASVALGQGVFRLDAALSPLRGVTVRQFNRSPQDVGSPDEQDADFIVVRVPREYLGGARPGESVMIGALVLGSGTNGLGSGLAADPTFLGGSFQRSAEGSLVLAPATVTLGAHPDGDDDLDGLSSADEARLGGDPRNPDTDGDGLPDGWEADHGLRLELGVGADGATGDPDGDGYSNAEEWRSGTDPRDGRRTLKVGLAKRGAEWWVSWRAMVGRRYDVEASEQVGGGYVSAGLPGLPRVAAGTNEAVRLPSDPLPVARWFRVRELE